MDPKPKTRLFVEADLSRGAQVALGREQSHYLVNVMRLEAGAPVALFNGRDGEWRAELTDPHRKGATLTATDRIAEQAEPPDLWLLFAPIKKARTDFIAEKACEMGCRRVVPVFTRFTNSERVNAERLRAHAIEAAEQCGLTSVPDMAEPIRLDALLDDWPADRRILFCDEAREATPAFDALRAAGPGPWAILIGPEGGFSPEEAARLKSLPYVTPVSLGPRILRADTAAVAAAAVWQSALGDWRNGGAD